VIAQHFLNRWFQRRNPNHPRKVGSPVCRCFILFFLFFSSFRCLFYFSASPRVGKSFSQIFFVTNLRGNCIFLFFFFFFLPFGSVGPHFPLVLFLGVSKTFQGAGTCFFSFLVVFAFDLRGLVPNVNFVRLGTRSNKPPDFFLLLFHGGHFNSPVRCFTPPFGVL